MAYFRIYFYIHILATGYCDLNVEVVKIFFLAENIKARTGSLLLHSPEIRYSNQFVVPERMLLCTPVTITSAGVNLDGSINYYLLGDHTLTSSVEPSVPFPPWWMLPVASGFI
jgi:hypothetical protein